MKPLILSSLILLAHGCCTEAFCRDGVRITVRRAAGAVATGDYIFRFTTPSAQWESQCKLADEPGFGLQLRCDNTGPGPSAPFFYYDSIEGTFVLEVIGTPSEVRLEVLRDGLSLGVETLRPSYVTNRPNGPRCEPECRQSGATLTLQ